jgi:hypothetical protein
MSSRASARSEVKAPEESGAPLSHGPFFIGFFGALGALTAFWLGTQVLAIGHILVLILVALFLAAGLNPAVLWIMSHELRGRRVKRHWALLIVITVVIGVLALFLAAIVPVIGEQVALITAHAPGWLDQLEHNRQIQKWNDEFALIEKAKAYIEDGELGKRLFGGVLGFGLAVLSALGNAFVVIVLTLYFLASIDKTKDALYELAPASRRARVRMLGDRIILSVGGYVSGAFIVAVCAGVSSLVFLRRRTGVHGGPARRDPDDRRDHRRRRGHGDRLRDRPPHRHRLRDLLRGLPAGRELRDLPQGHEALGRRPRLGHGHRGPHRRCAPRRGRRDAGDPDGGRHPPAGARGLHPAAEHRLIRRPGRVPCPPARTPSGASRRARPA